MYFLIFFMIFCMVYIAKFKDDFTKEHLDKVVPFFIILGIISLILVILTNIV